MLVIGLTGGIGSGKSSVADLFQQLDIPVIDADEIAREVVEPDTAGYQKIIEKFGSDVIDDKGKLDRERLRQLIFSSATAKQWLENLLHPLIRQTMEQRLQTIHAPYCILVVPLLIEKHPYPLVNRILVVDIEESEQIKRACQRDHSTEQAIRSIIASQAPRPRRLQLADDVINNNGSFADLKRQVTELHQYYLTLAEEKN